VIVSTHLLGYIESLCDRVLILADGRAKALGSVGELLAGADGMSLEDRFLEIVEEAWP
jgi:ABC-2 type transport system ATP-binding protein